MSPETRGSPLAESGRALEKGGMYSSRRKENCWSSEACSVCAYKPSCKAIDHALAAARTNRFHPRRLGPKPSDRDAPDWTEKEVFIFLARRDGRKRPRRKGRPTGRERTRRETKRKGASTVWGPRHYESSTVWGPLTHAHEDARANARAKTHQHTHARATSPWPDSGHLLVVVCGPASCPWWMRLVWH
jgi:hypothetical protein